MTSFGVEVDNNYESVAASWFSEKINTHKKLKKKERATEDESTYKRGRNSKREALPAETVESFTNLKKKKVEENIPNEIQPHNKHEQQGLPAFLSDKVMRKLKKNKQNLDKCRAEERADGFENSKNRSFNEDEESKASVMSKRSRVSGDKTVTETTTMASIQQLLKDPSKSKSCKKRLRKKLKKLKESSNQNATPVTIETSTANSSRILSPKPSTACPTAPLHKKKEKHEIINVNNISSDGNSEHSNGSPRTVMKSDLIECIPKGKEKRKHSVNSCDEPPKKKMIANNCLLTHKDDSTTEQVMRRKRNKKRSKQKNIKKDHRPEHLKPSHLRKDSASDGS